MDLKTVKDLRAKITPGEWKKEKNYELMDDYNIYVGEDSVVNTGCCCGSMKENDADFISQAPAMIDFLLSEVERLEGENNSMRYAIGYCSGWCQNALDALESGKNIYLKRYQDNAEKLDLDKAID